MNSLAKTLFTNIVLVLLLLASTAYSQHPSTLLLITNKNAKVIFDGEEKGLSESGIPFKIATSEGEHYAQVQYEENGAVLNKAELITLEAGKQKIIKLLFEETEPLPETIPPVHIGELNFTIPGSVNVGLWSSNNPNVSYPYPSHYFAFEKGDEIIINTSMTNKKGTNMIEVATYPNNVIKYTNRSFTELKDLRIKVEERSIYRLTFATNHAFDRNCILTIGRKPASAETATFNTSVSKQKIYRPTSVIEPSSQWINSGSNSLFAGGKSRVVLPVTLPPNTAEWFYRFSASRNKEDIENVRSNFQLLGELTKLLLVSTGVGVGVTKAVSIGVEQLTMPPGANICDIFLLEYNAIGNFESKNDSNWEYILQGSRKNLMSGNVKVNCCNEGQYYLGIRNPAAYDGINVSVEVIAITVSEEYVMEGVN